MTLPLQACPAPTQHLAREAVTADFMQAFRDRDRVRVNAAARYLRSTGTPLAELHEAMLDVLAADGPHLVSASSPDRATRDFTSDVVARLREPRSGPGRGHVLLAAPHGERHALGTAAVAHLFEEAGWRVTVAPTGWAAALEAVAAEPALACVLVSLHERATFAADRTMLTRMRAEVPQALVLVTGEVLTDHADVPGAVGAHAAVWSPAAAVRALEERGNPLSHRERQVLTCVARGLSNPTVAAELGVGSATVKTHLDRVYLKLGTHDRAAAVATALRRGWVD